MSQARLPPVRAARDEPRAFRLAEGSPCSIRAEAAPDPAGGPTLPTFEGVAYTGAVMRPHGWWHDVIVDLAGVVVPSQHRPALRQHDYEQIVGHTREVKVTKGGKSGKVTVAGVFSGEPQHRDKVVVPAKNGFQWQLSIGADPVRTEFLEAGETATVNGREVTGPLTISRETRLGEVSFVPLGADGDTSATVTAQRGKTTMDWKAALKELLADLRAELEAAGAKCHTDAEIDNMSADEARSALKKYMKHARQDEEDEEEDEDDEEEDAKARKAKAKKASAGRAAPDISAAARLLQKELRRAAVEEQKRQGEIRALAERHGAGRKGNLVEQAILDGWTVERVKAALLDHLRDERPGAGVGVPGGLAFSTGAADMSEEVMEAGLLHACRHQFRLEDDSFYSDPTPDGSGTLRRVPARMQAETQRELRARYSDKVRQTAHDMFFNSRHQNYVGYMSPKVLFNLCFRAAGYQGRLDLSSQSGVETMLRAWDRLEPRDGIRAEGTSTLAISNILANVMNKFALQGYLFTEQAWREIAAIRPVNDFKPTKSINLLGDVMYKALGPDSELSQASVGDQAFSNQATPYGRIATIPWTSIVNDDLGMLTGVPLKIGQGAGLALNDLFWALWAALAGGSTAGFSQLPNGQSVNGDDGNAFWRTGSSLTAAASRAGTAYNKNKLTGVGSALSTTALQSAKAAFDNQVDPNGNPLGFDGTMPILLHGPTNWQTAQQLLYGAILIAIGLASTSAASTQSAKNVWAGKMRPVMSRYIENANYVNSATAWWVLFDPAALPVIEVAFLNGVDTPAVLQAGPDWQFDRLGVSIRGTMPFGANQQNFRGGIYNAGA
jgi:hypothetical protein